MDQPLPPAEEMKRLLSFLGKHEASDLHLKVGYPATEVLLANAIVKQKISHEEDEDLPAILHQCRDEGMRDYTYSLCELVNQDKILRTVAMDYAPSREALSAALKGIDSAAASILARIRD